MSRQILDDDAAVIHAAAQNTSVPSDYDPLVDMTWEAQVVLIGEASHGTHEFYATRSEITQRLIDEKGFRAVAVEADWPDSYRVDRYVTRRSEEIDPAAALDDFRRFPTWMWRNTVGVAFALGENRTGVRSCRAAYTGFSPSETEKGNGKEPTGDSICGY